MTAHRYWGLYLLGSAGNKYEFNKCQMFLAADPSVNIAVDPTDGTAYATQTWSGTTPAHGFDTDPGHFWASQDNSAQYIWFDFGVGNEQDIAGINLLSDDAYNLAPTEFVIVSSDDAVTWTNQSPQFSGIVWTGSGELKTFAVSADATGAHIGQGGVSVLMTISGDARVSQARLTMLIRPFPVRGILGVGNMVQLACSGMCQLAPSFQLIRG